ncbi:MAG: tetraacyldisaccharide 4'-kinase [Polynucleobacter sp.]|nr:MAG: tetraacyldisaccharide 4'-kinase [Polynucleobacter sp.]
MRQAPRFWEKRGLLARLLWPLSKLFGFISTARRYLYEFKILKSRALPVPLIIVGNIRVGGTGKTPTVLAIAKALQAKGFHPGIISRGYKGQHQDAEAVSPTSSPSVIGDEPCYMAQQLSPLNIPVYVHRQRFLAASALLEAHPNVDVIISDDGLQHYALERWPAREGGRDIELVVRDARGEGNEYLLPAGPLREPSSRPRDYTINMGTSGEPYLAGSPSFDVEIKVKKAYQLQNPSNTLSLSELQSSSEKILAAAGLGNPQKFFDLLKAQALEFDALALADHYNFIDNPFTSTSADVILITEKDAVKCSQLETYKDDHRIWVLPIEIKLPASLMDLMADIIKRPQPC